MNAAGAKAQALFRDLGDKLIVRLTGNSGINTVRRANDANGWPMLFLSVAGNEAEGQPVIALRMEAVDAVSRDVFGNDLIAYAPHFLQIAFELSATANLGLPSIKDVTQVEYEAFKLGSQIQLIEIANGTAVTEASMNAAAPVISLDDLYWPTKSV